MYIFGTTNGRPSIRGCFHEMSLSGAGSIGATLQLPGSSGGQYPKAATDPFFINSVTFAQKERYSVVQCFNARNYVYAFGHDPLSSMVAVRFTAFLVDPGDVDKASGSSLTALSGMYARARLFNSLQRCKVNIAGQVLTGFMLGMEASVASAELNLYNVDTTLLMTEPKQ